MDYQQNKKNKILVSQHKSRKLSDFNNLRDLDLTNGTDPGQHFFSLYDALTELCKEKKCTYSNLPSSPIIGLLNYTKAKSGTYLSMSKILIQGISKESG